MNDIHHRPHPFGRAVRAAWRGGLLAVCLVSATSANAALTFVFDYNANNGNTEFLGAGAEAVARRAALETAGTLFSNYFGSVFTNSATISLAVEGTNQGCSGGCTLAFAGSFRSFIGPGFGTSEVVRNKLVDGVDINGSANDGVVGVNWGAPWEKDPNVSVAAQNTGNFDLYAALFHEFTHAVGFASVLQENGSDGTMTGPLTGGNDTAGFWAKFDEFKTNCGGTDLIDHTTLRTNQPTYDNAKTSAMCFNGANAVAANGGNEVNLYAPNPYSAGSTGSHVNEQGGNLNAMMVYDRDPNVDEARTYNAIEIGLLTDIGYTRVVPSQLPEPGTIALVMAGLACAVTSRRRRA